MTIKEALSFGRGELQQAGIDSAQLDSELLLAFATGLSREFLHTHPEKDLPTNQSVRFQDLISRRAKRVPLVHLINKREFYGLEMFVDERVLTPRVETEKMVELANKHALSGVRVLDIGTGSGAVAIALKKHRPDLEVWASEVSAQALEVAKKNAHTHQTEINFVESDLFDKISGKFQLITANLPYLKPNTDLMPEVKKEPRQALIGGGEDGLELYRKFLKQVPEYLDAGCYLFTECDPWQQPEILQEAAKLGLQPIEQDYFILGFKRGI